MQEKRKEAILYKITRPIITFGFKILFRPTIIGVENIPEGRCVLAGNHTSNLDCLLLISSTKRCIHFLAKNELWKGLKKIIFSNMGLIPVNRKTKDHQALVSAIEYLNDEKLIGIFPEGTTEKEKIMLPFKIGAVKMAKETKSPIIPFKIIGNYKIFSKKTSIIFDKPIYITDDNLDKENENLRNIILNLR